ncbi:MAG: GSU2403 family nucleotidyltransferase fold protein [bacterium]
MRKSPESCFPPEIHNLLISLGRVGFFERSILIGSWVMPVYQVTRGIQYVLRTSDIDFAVSLAHPRARMRADLEEIITDLGFVCITSIEGIQKFSAGGYEVELVVHRPGGKSTGATVVGEWNINAQPLPLMVPSQNEWVRQSEGKQGIWDYQG